MKWHLILVYAFLAFALFLAYGIGQSLYVQDYQLMDIVADVGAILICLDLAASSYLLNMSKNLETQAPEKFSRFQGVVRVTRKIGHLGIMLILCGWIVPMMN
jgi:hypothetical protein